MELKLVKSRDRELQGAIRIRSGRGETRLDQILKLCETIDTTNKNVVIHDAHKSGHCSKTFEVNCIACLRRDSTYSTTYVPWKISR